ncbi:T9SS type A sorting domain-containing protein [Flavobacterium urocaniciphilum]|uniref:Por secretion system C-terminal sorting domain-containing protein n=1 Tax=Flavobacterium urocaniciphilum TaxID=1299341 RepID=A0A1H8ZAK2_9FLAO|nr:T9SS type A sorting domain-containing protein [Flavobacterium urocaniciphilum]SEP61509.1 Por secretion system C-terminal sorting domain-containing protein [Flavobacterium urocaniciphilum]
MEDGLPTTWATRTVGNNIIEVEVDINTGVASTSRNTFGVYIFDGTGSKVLVGFSVRAATKEIFLTCYSTPTGNPVGNYTYNLAAAPGIQLPENAWSRIGISFNTVTGRAMIKGPGIDPAGLFLDGSAPGTDPGEVDMVSFSGHATATPNTTSAAMTFDNLVVRATATDSLLGTSDFNTLPSSVSNVYPNPVVDYASISIVDAQINAITVMDINGRVVKQGNSNEIQNAKIDLSDLNAGIYLMTIDTDKGISTEKIVKN